MDRRRFLQGILAAGIAPWVVTTGGVLMPVRQIAAPILWGDGIHDDTKALQAWFDGTSVLRPNGLVAAPCLIGEKFRLTDTIFNRTFLDRGVRRIDNSYFLWTEPLMGIMPRGLG